jgi:DNA-binding NarL/FixJ family response regulator
VSGPLRVVVVDDNAAMRKTAVDLLASIPGVELVGQASSGLEALEVMNRLRPDLVLMDLVMPELDGLEVTRRLVAQSSAPAVIIMTAHDLPQYRDAALAAGARRFVAKSDLFDQLGPAIHGLFLDAEACDDDKSGCRSAPPGPPLPG